MPSEPKLHMNFVLLLKVRPGRSWFLLLPSKPSETQQHPLPSLLWAPSKGKGSAAAPGPQELSSPFSRGKPEQGMREQGSSAAPWRGSASCPQLSILPTAQPASPLGDDEQKIRGRISPEPSGGAVFLGFRVGAPQ